MKWSAKSLRRTLYAFLFLFASNFAPFALWAAPSDNSDLNNDGVVDAQDLELFASEYLGEDAATMDWCAFADATELDADLYGRRPEYYTKHFGELIEFIDDAYCAFSDMNGDGLPDMMVGGVGWLEQSSGSALTPYEVRDVGDRPAYVVFDAPTGTVELRERALRIGDGAGYGVDFAGDVDGDGFDDLLFGCAECNSAYLLTEIFQE